MRILGLLMLAGLLGACAGGAQKKISPSEDYTNPTVLQESYYEFTSPEPQPAQTDEPLEPSITGDLTQTEQVPGEDEDFTSENLTTSYQNYGDVVATVATRKFKLGQNASRKEMKALMEAVDSAYAQTVRTYRPSGFTYSLSSVGAVNPLSDVQVYCRMSEQSANHVGQAACTQFFNAIRSGYVRRMQEDK